MAIQILGRDESATGTWQIDYDDIGLTVGHTCTTTNPNARLTLTVSQVFTTGPNAGQPTGLTFTKDVTGDFGKGRIVDFSGIANSVVPPHVKGTIYPFTFSGQWS